VTQIAQALRPGGKFVFVTSYLPSMGSLVYWLARGFNAAMHVRNFVWSPKFIMYYLTFLLPEVKQLLESAGFDVEVRGDAADWPWKALKLVTATKRAVQLPASQSRISDTTVQMP
jgi:hypothetical protein